MLTLPPSKNGESLTRRRFNRGKKIKTLPANVVWEGRPSIVLAIGKLNKLLLAIIVMFIVGWNTNWTYPAWLIAASLGLGAYSVVTWLAKVVTILCIRYTIRSEEHTSELQSRPHLVCRHLLEKKNRHFRERSIAQQPFAHAANLHFAVARLHRDQHQQPGADRPDGFAVQDEPRFGDSLAQGDH